MSPTSMTSAIPDAPAARRVGFSTWSLPIALFSIPLGVAGLGGTWSAAAELLGASRLPAEVAFVVAALVWVAFTVVYVVGAIRHDSGRFGVDLRRPLFGPLTAYIPAVAILPVSYLAGVNGFSSTSSLTKVSLAPCSALISSRIGEIRWHGPHQSAQKIHEDGLVGT